MTVIAWDGETLAADTRCGDGSDNSEVRKIWRLQNGYLFGGAGDAGFCSLVRHWLERSVTLLAKGDEPPDLPKVYGDGPPAFSGLLVSPDGQCFILDQYLGPIETLGGPQAVGSGASHALTLMKTGHTAEQAVATIIREQLADGVGGRVLTLSLEDIRKS